MVTAISQIETDLQHITQIRNTAQVTRRVFEGEIASHVNALESEALRLQLARVVSELMALEDAVRREIANVIA